MHVHDTWYVLEDGTKADPHDVSLDDKGVLRHVNGLAVAMRGPIPHTSGAAEPAAVTKAPALADMTLTELKDLAARHGVDLGDATKKADIVAALESREVKASGTGLTYQTR